MPAVVRGGRRQNSQAPKRGAPAGASRGGPRNAPATAAKVAALGKLDLSPRAVMIGARADRIGASIDQGVASVASGLGLTLDRVHITGASEEATPSIRRALQVQAGQPITTLDLAAIQARVQSVGWVESARVVRLLPDTLIVEVVEHDRLAVWQTGGRAFVVDGSGKIIPGADPGRYPALPLIVGQGADQAASEILPLLDQRPRLMSRVDALVRVDERRWDLRLK
ncbi:MAG: cell division protein FtsQ, partial [Alphaproteobacteria bacterium]